MPLNDFAKKWLAVLRTDDYEQGKQRLFTAGEDGVDRFCCLGVACDLWLKDNPDAGRWELMYEGSDIRCFIVLDIDGERDQTEIAVLPPAVRDALGMREAFGRPDSNALPTVTEMNDKGDSFAQIADALEANADAYFTPPNDPKPEATLHA